jgi:hypothetical protein
MIGAVAKLLGLDRWIVGAIAALALAAALAGAVAYVDHRGYARAETHYKAEISELKRKAADSLSTEIERQAGVQSASKAREATRITEMQAETESLELKIKELEREADQDPDAGKPALGASGVQRINKIR